MKHFLTIVLKFMTEKKLSDTFRDTCRRMQRLQKRKAYEFPGHKVYSIADDSLFFLSFTKRVFRHPDLPASSPVRHFASA